jgi:tetratricopeptide (TPR) repeat protein
MKSLATVLVLMMTYTLFAQTSETDYEQGIALMKHKKYEDALVLLEKFEQQSVKKKRVYEKMATCHYKLGHYNRFLEECDKGLAYNKKDKTKYYMMLGIYYSDKMNDSQKAIEYFTMVKSSAQKELEGNPTDKKKYKLQRNITFAQTQLSKM